jgi:dipeptidyl aminopeptidase/acylaminoacyl peptidase
METVEYAAGRHVDLYGDPAALSVLLWHGTQTDSRAAVGPLSELIAGHGLAVAAPGWDSHAADGGRSDLLRSVDFARERAVDPDGLLLVGWSLGGLAAAGITVHAARFDVRFAHTVCLAGAFMARDPVSGEKPTDGLSDGVASPFTLLHGVADDVVPISQSRTFAAKLDKAGWPVDLVELDTDHGAIAGAEYDAGADRYDPAHDTASLTVAADVAARIARCLQS